MFYFSTTKYYFYYYYSFSVLFKKYNSIFWHCFYIKKLSKITFLVEKRSSFLTRYWTYCFDSNKTKKNSKNKSAIIPYALHGRKNIIFTIITLFRYFLKNIIAFFGIVFILK